MHCSSQPGRRARGGIARNTRSAGGELADCEMHPFDQLMSENIQGLLLSINELATSAAAEGNEIRLVAACEVLRNSGAESFFAGLLRLLSRRRAIQKRFSRADRCCVMVWSRQQPTARVRLDWHW